MRFNDISFPHPVLGVGNSVLGECSLSPTPEITMQRDHYHIEINCSLDNPEIKELLATNAAEYVCEVSASNTVYRKIFTSSTPQLSFDIPRKQVKGKVTFNCFLLTKSSIENYKNSRFHDDYSGFTFKLDEGDILAYFGQFNFNSMIKYEKLKSVSSFMEVKKRQDPNDTTTYFNLEEPKILILLPQNDYEIYADDSISKEPKLAAIFHASIVLSALLIALYNFNKDSDLLWVEVIKLRLEEKAFEGLSIDETENIPEIAQLLLGNPISRLMNDMKQVLNPSIIEEDD